MAKCLQKPAHLNAIALAQFECVGFKNLKEMRTYNVGVEFKREVYAILDSSPTAQRDFAFIEQLRESASGVPANTAEGFGRFLPGDFIRYLRISISCACEAMTWLEDGVDRRHWNAKRIVRALELGDEVLRLLNGLIASLLPFTNERGRRRRRKKSPDARKRPKRANPDPSKPPPDPDPPPD